MERGRGRREGEVHGGDALCLGQWYRVELVLAKGWRIPATPPYVSSYLFLLPVYDAPSSAERKERIGEEERGGRGRERGEGGGEMVCQYSLCLRRKRRGRGGGKREKWKRNEMVGIYVWKACATHGTQEFTATRTHVKRTGEKGNRKNVPPNQCSRPTELIPRERLFCHYHILAM